jgi:hypothetical protein
MVARRIVSFLLVSLFFVIFGISMNTTTTVQADDLLQNVPRLDGMNIYFTEANGEASRFDRTSTGLSHFAGLLGELGANLFTMEWRTGIPADTNLIVIAGPVNDLQPDQIARLWLYLSKGGRLLLLANTTTETRGPTGALPANSGLFTLMWADLGLRARGDVVAAYSLSDTDASGATVDTTEEAIAAATAAATDESGAPQATEAAAPDLTVPTQANPLYTNLTTSQVNPSDPITQNLSGPLAFFLARSIEVDQSPQAFHAVSLISTTDRFYGETNYAQYLKDGTSQFNIGIDTTFGALALAASSESKTSGARVILIGDREFATNGAGLTTSPANSPSFVYPENARFMLNTATWLLGQGSVSMDFPTPAPTATVTMTPSPTPISSPTPAAT